MSKKLIAVASAAALALTGLVGIAPANASAPSIAILGGTGVGTSAAAPAKISVPYNNTIDHDGSGSIDTAVKFTIGSSPALVIGDVITVTPSADVKLVESEIETANANFNASTLGKTSLTYTKTNTTAVEFFAYTTKAAVGTVKIDISRTGLNTSTTYYIEGLPGLKHTVANVTGLPTTLANTASAVVNFTVSDVFGNTIENEEAAVSASTTRSGGFGLITWNASKKAYQTTLTSTSSSVFLASIDLNGADIAGMADASDKISVIVNNSAVSTQVATLTTQLAEANAKLANRVTKKRFNTLARKWNAANPSAKVKLKK